VVRIADRMQHWVSCGDVQLQMLAVNILSNLSLVDSQRAALAERRLLNSIIGKLNLSFCWHGTVGEYLLGR